MNELLTIMGFLIFVIGIVALIKGNIRRLKIKNRKIALIVLVVGFVVIAVFVPEVQDYYVVELNVEPTESGEIIGEGNYEKEEEVKIKAIPGELYTFNSWVDKDGNIVSNDEEYTFIITEDTELLAKFERRTNKVKVELKKHVEEGGEVKGGGLYNKGEKASIKAITENNYDFKGWMNQQDEMISDNKEYTFEIKEDIKLTAIFEGETCKVELSTYPEIAGNVKGSGYYNYGEEVTITALPNKGYKFLHWVEEDEKLDYKEEHTFKVKDDITLLANFEINPQDVMTTIENEVGKETTRSDYPERVKEANIGTGNVVLHLVSDDGLTVDGIKRRILRDSLKLFEQIYSLYSDEEYFVVNLIWYAPLTDQYGHEELGEVIDIGIYDDTAKKINWDNIDVNNLENVADYYTEHSSFN